MQKPAMGQARDYRKNTHLCELSKRGSLRSGPCLVRRRWATAIRRPLAHFHQEVSPQQACVDTIAEGEGGTTGPSSLSSPRTIPARTELYVAKGLGKRVVRIASRGSRGRGRMAPRQLRPPATTESLAEQDVGKEPYTRSRARAGETTTTTTTTTTTATAGRDGVRYASSVGQSRAAQVGTGMERRALAHSSFGSTLPKRARARHGLCSRSIHVLASEWHTVCLQLNPPPPPLVWPISPRSRHHACPASPEARSSRRNRRA